MKKNFTLSLDKEPVDVVKMWLKSTGALTFSGFVNGILTEFAKEIEGQPVRPDKPVKDLTLEEFGKLISHWTGLASS